MQLPQLLPCVSSFCILYERIPDTLTPSSFFLAVKFAISSSKKIVRTFLIERTNYKNETIKTYFDNQSKEFDIVLKC